MTKHRTSDDLLRATMLLERAFAPELVPPAATESRSIDVVASTDDPDREGRIVLQDWDLANYERNPIVLWNHGNGGGGFFSAGDPNAAIPIGFATNVRVEDNKLLATLTFVDASANPVAEQIYQGVRQGSLRAVSIGWFPGSVEELEDGTLIVKGNELLEISVVATPANPAAGRVEAARFHASLQSAANHKKENTMIKLLIASLGLADGATEADVVAKVKEGFADRDSLKVQVAALTAARDSATGRVTELEAKLASEAESRTHSEVASLIADGERAGKLTPGNKATWLQLCGGDAEGKGADPARLKACIDALPVVVNASVTPTGPTASVTTTAVSVASLTASDLAYCEKNKITPERYAASKAAATKALGGVQ